MRKGNKLICLNNIDNLLGQPLFIKDDVYDILYVDNEDVQIMICLNHILYANEYNKFSLEFIKSNFSLYE